MTEFQTLSGQPVAPVAYGCMQWGGRADEGEAAAMFDAARAAGIMHFDTAHVYTGGASEKILGRLAAMDRDDLFIATKADFNLGSARDALTRSLSVSLERLRMDQADLFYLHRFDPEVPLEESFSTLREFQDKGLIRHIGVSNFAAWQVMKAQAIANGLGTRIDAIQPMMNLVKRQVEVEILPMAADQEIAVCAYSPLGGGLLTGKYAGTGSGRLTEDKMYHARYGAAWMHDAAEGLARIAAREGVDPATLAVSWLRHHAPQVHPILSARSAAQLGPSIAGLTHVMRDALLAEITALSPAPPPATDRLEEA